MDSRRDMDLVGSWYRQGTAITMLDLCWSRRTRSVVASLHSSVRRSETLAAILQVSLVLNLPPHGGVPVVLDGVVRTVGEKISNVLENNPFHDSNWK